MTPRRATKGEWAVKKVAYVPTDPAGKAEIVQLLKAEHARAVRIVKAEIKRVTLDQHYYIEGTRDMILYSLNAVLNKLQRGR